MSELSERSGVSAGAMHSKLLSAELRRQREGG